MIYIACNNKLIMLCDVATKEMIYDVSSEFTWDCYLFGFLILLEYDKFKNVACDTFDLI